MKLSAHIQFILLFAFAAVFFSACQKLNYEEADISDTFSEDLPNSVLVDFSQTVVENGKVAYFLAADRAEVYEDSETTYFQNLLFKELDENMAPVIQGAADKAVYNSGNDSMIFDGRMIISSDTQDFVLKSSYIEWDNEKKIMKSLDNSKVSIQQKDGSYIEGTGFIADASNKSFTFLEHAEGKLIDEKD